MNILTKADIKTINSLRADADTIKRRLSEELAAMPMVSDSDRQQAIRVIAEHVQAAESALLAALLTESLYNHVSDSVPPGNEAQSV